MVDGASRRSYTATNLSVELASIRDLSAVCARPVIGRDGAVYAGMFSEWLERIYRTYKCVSTYTQFDIPGSQSRVETTRISLSPGQIKDTLGNLACMAFQDMYRCLRRPSALDRRVPS